jgi:hypothetical protein
MTFLNFKILSLSFSIGRFVPLEFNFTKENVSYGINY